MGSALGFARLVPRGVGSGLLGWLADPEVEAFGWWEAFRKRRKRGGEVAFSDHEIEACGCRESLKEEEKRMKSRPFRHQNRCICVLGSYQKE